MKTGNLPKPFVRMPYAVHKKKRHYENNASVQQRVRPSYGGIVHIRSKGRSPCFLSACRAGSPVYEVSLLRKHG